MAFVISALVADKELALKFSRENPDVLFTIKDLHRDEPGDSFVEIQNGKVIRQEGDLPGW